MSCIICIVLMVIILLDVSKSEFSITHNTTNYTSWKSAQRSKRSVYDDMPDQLNARMQLPFGKEIEVHWIKKQRHLANEHLPVSTTVTGLQPNVMANVGEFVLYRDVEKSSAVVYFKNLNSLYGVIGMEYSIEGLPLYIDKDGKYTFGAIDQQNVKQSHHPFFHNYPDENASRDLECNDGLNQGVKRPFDGEPGPSTKHQRTEQDTNEQLNAEESHLGDNEINTMRNGREYSVYKEYYLETMVFVTHDIAQRYRSHAGNENYLEWIVRDHIVYFNAVEMTFDKLHIKNGKFFINIARIIVEHKFSPLNFMMSNGKLHFNDIVARIPQYLHMINYMPDSFDYIFIHASRTITDELYLKNALTKYGEDLFEARKDNRFYDVVPVSLVGFEYHYADYVAAVHEIGRVLNLKVTSQNEGLKCKGQCHGIMQRGGPKCKGCFEWCGDSQKQFQAFFRGNRNRCFLLNKPRSLRAPGERIKNLTPYEQCQCFGFPSNVRSCKGSLVSSVGVHGCSRPLECLKVDGDQSYSESTVQPFDGTKCSSKRVCWNGRCAKM